MDRIAIREILVQNGLAAIQHVVVVVPDRELRRSIEFALEAEGFAISSHDRLEAALASPRIGDTACAVIDEAALGAHEGKDALAHIFPPVVLLVDRLRAGQTQAGIRVLTKPLLGRMLVETVQAIIAGGSAAAASSAGR